MQVAELETNKAEGTDTGDQGGAGRGGDTGVDQGPQWPDWMPADLISVLGDSAIDQLVSGMEKEKEKEKEK